MDDRISTSSGGRFGTGVVLVVALLAASGCSEFFRDVDDVEFRAADTGSMADGGGDTGNGGQGCDPLEPSGTCPTAQYCTVVRTGSTAAARCVDRPDATVAVGESCGPEASGSCEPGTLCRNWRKSPETGTVCSPLCDGSSGGAEDCGSGDTCTAPFESEALGDIEVCKP